MQIVPALETGGVERGTIEVAYALKNAGFSPVVASQGGRLVQKLVDMDIEHWTLPLAEKNPYAVMKCYGGLRRLMKRLPIQVVHARSRLPAWISYALCREQKIPFVTTFHGAYNFTHPLKHFYNSIMVKGQRVIAISEFIGRHIEENYKVDKDHLSIINRGVDVHMFRPSQMVLERANQLKLSWGLDPARPIILFPGRLTPWKGQRILIEALHKKPFNVQCVFLGDPQGRRGYLQSLQEIVQNYGLQSCVKFVHHVDDMPAAYALADVVVHASTDPEAFGRVIIEAMAMEKPVIASALGAPLDIIQSGRTGWLVPPGDPLLLADALENVLLLSSDKLRAVGASAAQHVRSCYSQEQMCAATLKVYEDLLRKPFE